MKKLLLVTLMLLSFSAFADIGLQSIDQAGFDKLSDQQKAQILQQITSQASKSNASIPDLDNIDNHVQTWAKLLSSGIGEAAKNLGMAINDFANSKVGKLTMILLIWKLIGGQILHFVVGFIILIGGIYIANKFKEATTLKLVTYSKDKTNWFGNPKIEEKVYNTNIGDAIYGVWFFYIAGIAAAFILFTTGF